MPIMKNIKYFEADGIEFIDTFVKDLLNYSRDNKCRVIGNINNICVMVDPQMRFRDITYRYRQLLEREKIINKNICQLENEKHILNDHKMTDVEKLRKIFDISKDSLKTIDFYLYYAILGVLYNDKKPDASSYFNTQIFPRLQINDIIEVYDDTEMRFFCNDEFDQHEDGRIQPNEDLEFNEKDITRVWRQVDDNYICIYKREFYRGKEL